MNKIQYDETSCGKCNSYDPYNQPCGVYLNQLQECQSKIMNKRIKPENRERWRLAGIFIIRQLQERGILKTNYTKEQLNP